MKDRKQIEVDITLQSPFVVVPEKGQLTDDANLIVADLGKLSVYGRTTDKHYSTIKVLQWGPQLQAKHHKGTTVFGTSDMLMEDVPS